MKTVPEMMREGAALYEQRNALYGDNYKHHGEVMKTLFPHGVVLATVDDHNRFGILTQMVAKLTRYAENWRRGGHEDSLADLAVYATMLRELDLEISSREALEPPAAPALQPDPVTPALGEKTGVSGEVQLDFPGLSSGVPNLDTPKLFSAIFSNGEDRQ